MINYSEPNMVFTLMMFFILSLAVVLIAAGQMNTRESKAGQILNLLGLSFASSALALCIVTLIFY